MKKKKTISIITGVYNEEAIVKDVYKSIKKFFKNHSQYNYEHLFLDNCSEDKTLSILKKIAKKDKKVKILSYSKNFGSIKSGFAGLKYTSGDAVVFYEANMKDPVSLISEFAKHWEKGYQLVYGARKITTESPVLALSRRIYYKFVNFLSSENLPLYFGGFAIIDRKIINEVIKIDDYKPYLRGLITTVGYKHKSIEYVRGARPKGKGRSKSSFAYLIDFAINGLINYSIVPIRLMTYAGLGLSSLRFLSAIIYLVLKLFYWKVTVPGLTAVIFLILFFSGIQLFFLGIIGEYIGAIHSQVRKKPFVVIKEKINFKK